MKMWASLIPDSPYRPQWTVQTIPHSVTVQNLPLRWDLPPYWSFVPFTLNNAPPNLFTTKISLIFFASHCWSLLNLKDWVLVCLDRVLLMWLRLFWRVWRKGSHLNPGLDLFAATTAAHAHPSGEASASPLTSGRFCPSTTVHRQMSVWCGQQGQYQQPTFVLVLVLGHYLKTYRTSWQMCSGGLDVFDTDLGLNEVDLGFKSVCILMPGWYDYRQVW